jgi:hypothetical protein
MDTVGAANYIDGQQVAGNSTDATTRAALPGTEYDLLEDRRTLIDFQRERVDDRRPQRNIRGERKSEFFRC